MSTASFLSDNSVFQELWQICDEPMLIHTKVLRLSDVFYSVPAIRLSYKSCGCCFCKWIDLKKLKVLFKPRIPTQKNWRGNFKLVQAGNPGCVHDSGTALRVFREAFAEKKETSINFKLSFNPVKVKLSFSSLRDRILMATIYFGKEWGSGSSQNVDLSHHPSHQILQSRIENEPQEPLLYCQ